MYVNLFTYQLEEFHFKSLVFYWFICNRCTLTDSDMLKGLFMTAVSYSSLSSNNYVEAELS